MQPDTVSNHLSAILARRQPWPATPIAVVSYGIHDDRAVKALKDFSESTLAETLHDLGHAVDVKDVTIDATMPMSTAERFKQDEIQAYSVDSVLTGKPTC